MDTKKKNLFLLLICIIIVLLFVIVILSMTSLPLMTSARENAFRIEANNIVKAAEKVYNDNKNNTYEITENNTNICKIERKICITINKLNSDNYYNNNKNIYKGKVEIIIPDSGNAVYTLYLRKGAEFNFVGLNYMNYTDYGQVNNASWLEEYEICNCETTK